MEMTIVSPPQLLSVGVAMCVYVVWVGPIGLFVLRKHLRNATGARLFVKTILTALTALTAPAAAIAALIVIVGTSDAVSLLWSLLKNSW